MDKSGYVNGSDMLLYIGNKAFGHCTTHTATFDSETKDRAVKPVASKTLSSGLWKETGVTGLSISISAEGLAFYDESEYSFADALAAWASGAAVTAKCMERAASSTDTPEPYLVGSFVITKLERTDPAQDDSTISIELKNNGEPDTLDKSAITVNAAA